jgi:hypothetical protein
MKRLYCIEFGYKAYPGLFHTYKGLIDDTKYNELQHQCELIGRNLFGKETQFQKCCEEELISDDSCFDFGQLYTIKGYQLLGTFRVQRLQ